MPSLFLILLTFAAAGPSSAQVVPLPLGLDSRVDRLSLVAIGPASEIYIRAFESSTLYRIDSDGRATEPFANGPQSGHTLEHAGAVLPTRSGTTIVADRVTANVFRIASNGEVALIADARAGGGGGRLEDPLSLAEDRDGSILVLGGRSSNLLRIALDGTITELIAAAGPEPTLGRPRDMAFDAAGNLYLIGTRDTRRGPLGYLLRRTPEGALTQLLPAAGVPDLSSAQSLAVGGDGTVFVAGSQRILAADPAGRIRSVLGPEQLGFLAPYSNSISDLALAPDATLYVAAFVPRSVFRLGPDGAFTEIVDASGDGGDNPLDTPARLLLAPSGHLIVQSNDKLLRIATGSDAACANGQDDDGDGLVDSTDDPGCSHAADNDEYDRPDRGERALLERLEPLLDEVVLPTDDPGQEAVRQLEEASERLFAELQRVESLSVLLASLEAASPEFTLQVIGYAIAQRDLRELDAADVQYLEHLVHGRKHYASRSPIWAMPVVAAQLAAMNGTDGVPMLASLLAESSSARIRVLAAGGLSAPGSMAGAELRASAQSILDREAVDPSNLVERTRLTMGLHQIGQDQLPSR